MLPKHHSSASHMRIRATAELRYMDTLAHRSWPAAHPGQADVGDPPGLPHRSVIKVHDPDFADRRLLERVVLPRLFVLQVLSSQ